MSMSIRISVTGCVKITPAHDFNDYEIGKRHDLPEYNILDDNAAINESAPEPYRGLDRFEARKKIVKDLEKTGLAGQGRGIPANAAAW